MSTAISLHSHGDLTPAEVSAYYAARVPQLPQRGQQWRGPCPIHDGQDDNFAVEAETGLWFCHSQCARGGSVYDLEIALSNADFRAAANEVRRILGRPALRQIEKEPELKWGLLGWSHTYLRERIEKVEREKQWKHIVAYPYFHADGRFSYVKVRFVDKQNDKAFRQWAITRNGGWVTRKKAGGKPLLYRLNTLAAAEEVFIVNGEKAADRGATVLGIATTCTPDGEGKWCGEYTKALIGKLIRIVVDNDEKGEKHGKVVAEALAPHVQEVKIIRLPNLPPKGDLWDWIEAGGSREMLDKIVAKALVFEPTPPPAESEGTPSNRPAPAPGDWQYQLIMNKDGSPRALLANAITALRNAPEWNGVLGFNEFLLGTVALKRPPWDGGQVGIEWTDHEDRLTADWLQHRLIFVSPDTAGQAVQAVAKDRCFHPVREYLDALQWDGTARIDAWLSEYLGAERNNYAAAVGARWLISAVARIYQPGAKADCCLILEGPQGLKKSTALKTIAGEWFTDEIAELGSKDAALQTRGVWIIEIAELDSMSRADVSKIKAFMSRTCDRFRPPYGRRLIDSPRQCVFAGSVNQSTYLRDETGGRRFWPIACSRILIDELARDRDQLWAEAVVRYREGSVWWLDSVQLNRVAQEEQADRYEGDPWDEMIAAWLEHPTRTHDACSPVYAFTSSEESVSIHDVLVHAVGKRPEYWTHADKTRVGRCLRALGWERYRDREGPRLEWRFRPVGK